MNDKSWENLLARRSRVADGRWCRCPMVAGVPIREFECTLKSLKSVYGDDDDGGTRGKGLGPIFLRRRRGFPSRPSWRPSRDARRRTAHRKQTRAGKVSSAPIERLLTFMRKFRPAGEGRHIQFISGSSSNGTNLRWRYFSLPLGGS